MESHWDKAIDMYLLGLMSAEEREQFEKEMMENPRLTEEVLLRRDIIIGLHAAERRRLMEELQEYIAETRSQNRNKKRTLLYFILLVGVGVLIVLLWLLLQQFFMKTQF
jgi:anti-sigma factor RsiW